MPESSDCRPKAVKAVVGWKRPKARLVGAVFFCRGSRREPSGRYRFVLQKNCVRKGRLFRSKCVHKRKSIPNTESVRKTLPNAHFLRENWNYLYYSTSERKSLHYRSGAVNRCVCRPNPNVKCKAERKSDYENKRQMASAAAVPAAVPDGTAGGRIGNVSPRAGRRPRRSARCGGNLPDHSGGNRLHRRRTDCEQRRHPVARVGSSRHIRPL